METDELIGGRGASDQEGGMASMVYAGKIIKDLGLEDEYTLLVTGTVQEEDCDGLCWQYIIEQSGIRPEFVVSTEPTDCQIYRGQRGRMEIRVEVQGVSCHGSARSAAITPSSKWRRSSPSWSSFRRSWAMTSSSAKAP
jgi:putative selenium metabolism hydrolase